jgi:hypothetical protein
MNSYYFGLKIPDVNKSQHKTLATASMQASINSSNYQRKKSRNWGE